MLVSIIHWMNNPPWKWLVVLIIGLTTSLVIVVRTMQRQARELALIKQQSHQNELAYQQQLQQKADSIQILAVLSTNLEHDKKKMLIYIQQMQVVLDSFKNNGNALANTLKDSAGNKYVRVNFEGQVNKVFFYHGYTEYYLPPSTLAPSYQLTGVFAPILTTDSLFYDYANKLLLSKTSSLVPGIKIQNVHVYIDSSVYNGLMTVVENKTVQTVRAFPPLGVLLRANLGFDNVNSSNHTINLNLDASAMLYYKYMNITYYPFARYVSLGVFYNLDIAKIASKLF